jgi:RimJ/RimL family protein N-acetyltransferase
MENTKDIWTAEATLEGRRLRLEPIGLQHLESLTRNVLFPQYFVDDFGGCINKADVEKEIRHCLQARADQTENGFVMIDKTTGEAVGYSNYLYIYRKRLSLDIGRTRIGPRFQKTFVNTEAKLLMLEYAFEVLKCNRVGLKADNFNFNSQKAILRIGAKYEGQIRNHLQMPDGRKRDFHSYSIIDSEWTNVKKTLLGYVGKYDVQTQSL